MFTQTILRTEGFRGLTCNEAGHFYDPGVSRGLLVYVPLPGGRLLAPEGLRKAGNESPWGPKLVVAQVLVGRKSTHESPGRRILLGEDGADAAPAAERWRRRRWWWSARALLATLCTTRSRLVGTLQEAAPGTGYVGRGFPGGAARTQRVARFHSAADVRKTDTKASILALGDASLALLLLAAAPGSVCVQCVCTEASPRLRGIECGAESRRAGTRVLDVSIRDFGPTV